MAARSSDAPRFGRADLSNCEREQIHLAGSIQPHGALLAVREPDLVVLQASANATKFLNLSRSPVGRSLADLDSDLAERIRPHLELPLDRLPMAVRCHIGRQQARFDGLLHRPKSGGLIIELEAAGPPVNLSHKVHDALAAMHACPTMAVLCTEAARVFWELTGYDRVMVYRFDENGHGEVFAERRRPELGAFLGNRYPASDIPQIARRLYESNRVRVLVDVGYTPVPIRPRNSPVDDRELDMSLCFLRSMSPIHIQYLKNMGVGATLVASLMVGGKLWGLIACHHYAPRFIHYETRAVCELLAETISIRIAALESFAQAQAELIVRRLEQRMIQAIARDGDWRTALFDSSQPLLQALKASGAALFFEGQTLATGEVPGALELRNLAEWLDRQPRATVIATASLGIDVPAFAPMAPVASGVLAAPISNTPGEYLVWFRPELIRTVTWAGNPFQSIPINNDPSTLSPRRSFAQWHQVVERTSEAWSAADMAAARLIGETVTDVVLQFRSVRTLIAQTQLEQVSRQVRRAEQPVVIADAEGRILLVNQAFENLVQPTANHLRWADDFPVLFADPAEFRRILAELFDQRRAWRGEVQLQASDQTLPVMLRADPVFSAPDIVLGYVLLFTDLTDRRYAETARRQFQEEIVDRHRVPAVPLDSRNALTYRRLLASVVGNAQLAALEITEGVELAQVPFMLDSIQTSVDRAAELLERLVWHAAGSSRDS